jgi:V/A-type H+-transporting ATPase subunit A
LKSEFLDDVFLQQNAYDKVDAATSPERQIYVFDKIFQVMTQSYKFENKDDARNFFYELRQKFVDWNYLEMKSSEFTAQEDAVNALLQTRVVGGGQAEGGKTEHENLDESVKKTESKKSGKKTDSDK